MVAVFLPTKAEAAYSENIDASSTISTEEVKKIVEQTQKYSFDSTREMLEYEKSLGYLASVTSTFDNGSKYTIYVNRYTGYVYYENMVTGQILTSNPYDYEGVNQYYKTLSSQIEITYKVNTKSSPESPLYSSEEAAKKGQLTVSGIKGGLRVDYTLGETATRYLIPGRISAEDFETSIVRPMIERYEEVVAKYVKSLGLNLPENMFKINWDLVYDEYDDVLVFNKQRVLNQLEYHLSNISSKSGYDKNEYYSEYSTIKLDIDKLLRKFTLANPLDEGNAPFYAEGGQYSDFPKNFAIYLFTNPTEADFKNYSKILTKYCREYTFHEMYEDEAECGYVAVITSKPVFRCSLEYTFNEDGSLKVRLPASSIVYDETNYTLEGISLLKYFGAGDKSLDGYAFLPDGSGSIIEFSDFYNPDQNGKKVSIQQSLSVYGPDYAYSNITLAPYNEQVVLPVYGMVSTTSDVQSNLDMIKTGYFAIIDEGASLAQINIDFDNGHNYATTYASFSPIPHDVIQFNGSTAGVSGSYTMISESKYSGSYVLRYVMLTDDRVAQRYSLTDYTTASYVGMATYYREYLKSTGDLTPLSDTYDDLPLYVEALGSMEIVEKFMTFPVNVSVPLTTFDDVITMYEELSNAQKRFAEKQLEYQKLADAEDKNLVLKAQYQTRADKYKELSKSVDNIINVNFKLTGFANGGMYFTYPSRVRWERACGGKSGFASLVSYSKEVGGDAHLGVYPDFDFMYINNQEAFDGIILRGTAAKMVDNRYASKQEYDSIARQYETVYALVVSSSALDDLYTKFNKSYSKYGLDSISLSTIGSDLNSNFDEDGSVNREDAMANVVQLLDRMVNENNQSVMLSVGNSYTYKYADHIINIATDSSHYSRSSYAIPFVGMVLHGYVNYAGSPINQSGSPEYEILRSIESGASLYYILCYQNTSHMKDDELLSKYYGVSYENWYDTLVENYSILNDAIGGLQQYEIVDHRVVIAERVIEESELIEQNKKIVANLLAYIDAQIQDTVNAKYDEVFNGEYARGLKLKVNVDSVVRQAEEIMNLSREELDSVYGFTASLTEIANKYESMYDGSESNDPIDVNYIAIKDYTYHTNYITDSEATDSDYKHTEYTIDNGLVVMVTYRNDKGEEKVFILNYNVYAVNVIVDGVEYPLGKHDFAVKLDKEG